MKIPNFGEIEMHGLDREAMGKTCQECRKIIDLYPASVMCTRHDKETITVYLHKPCTFPYITKLVDTLKGILKAEGVNLDVSVHDRGFT